MKLSAATSGQLGPEVGVPAYDRAQLRVGIAHFGVGGFHRAHHSR